MEIYKVVQKEEARVKVEECLCVVLKDVVAFNINFQDIVRELFPTYWDFVGVLIQWEKYNQRTVEAKSKVDSSHQNTSTVKGKTVVNYLKKDFQLLGLVKSLFCPRFN